MQLIVGVGMLRTDDALDLARDAQAAGAAALLVAPISYTLFRRSNRRSSASVSTRPCALVGVSGKAARPRKTSISLSVTE